jgi:hypothetical protein
MGLGRRVQAVDLMTWLQTPRPCPNCGRQPTLDVAYFRSTSRDGSLYRFRYQCKRWLGLVKCCIPADGYAWITKDWGDLGKSEAARKWNEHGTKS